MKNTEFITDRVPITKEEVRTISLSKLDILNRKRFLDIGSGTGTVTIEARVMNPDLQVVTIEKNERAYELTKKNIEKFSLDGIHQILGFAPMDIERETGIGSFDSIFLGGSGENIEDIIKWSYDMLEDNGVFVANFILIENFNRCLDEMKSIGFRDIEVIQVQVNRLEKLGYGNYFKPENPIIIITGVK